MTSRGPSRESYTPTRKSRGWPAEATASLAAETALPAEGIQSRPKTIVGQVVLTCGRLLVGRL